MRDSKTEIFNGGLIPTTDAESALKFCQSLKSFLEGNSESSTAIANQERSTTPFVSVVIPVFNERENLHELYERLSATFLNSGFSYELLFIDDGTTDGSLEILNGFVEKDSRVGVIELARNFGQQVAFSAGLDFAKGDVVVVMDADLQDPPEAIPQFIEKLKSGFNVVYAVRIRRKEGMLKRVAYAGFYRLLKVVAQIDIPVDAGDFCVMDRRVVNLLRSMPERNRFIRGIRSWVGLKQIGIEVERAARYGGEPKYTFRQLVNLAVDGLISFSFMPLRFISVVGVSISIMSVMLAVFYAIKKMLFGLEPRGFATLVVMISFFAGMQLVTIGLIGEYVGRIFDEVKRRPLYVVRGLKGKQFH